jgi:hypothetical protein
MADVNYPECAAADVVPAKALRLAERMERIGRDARKLGVTIFCGSANDIRFHQIGNDRPLILVTFLGPFDGGDGSAWRDKDGLIRGE